MKFISIQEALAIGKGIVSIRGWIYRERKLKDKVFLVVRDSSNIIQCIISRDNKDWEKANKILIESSVTLTGQLQKDNRAPTGYELKVDKLDVIDYAEKFPITENQSIEFLADNRHLWLRSRKMTAILKVRSTLFGAVHQFFRKKGFYEYQSPIFQPTQSEGGSTVFKVNYFGNKLFLAQTWQLQAEPAIFSLEKIYTLAPSFRAERSKTSRHLTEYWHAEMEYAWADFEGLQEYIEQLTKYLVKTVLSKNSEELRILGRDITKLEPTLNKKFPRITYDHALKILRDHHKSNLAWGKDLRTLEEDHLSEMYDTPILVSRYPKKVKAFYMKEDPNDNNVVLGVDLIAPEHYGELVGGSQREENIEKLKENLRSHGEDPANYDFYLDTRRYGSVPHAGFGMGMERVVAWICGLDNIKDSIPFPRTMTRFKP